MKTNYSVLLLFILSFGLFCCDEEDEETETYVMCYKISQVSAGTQIDVNCRSSANQCDSGFTVLAEYSNFNDCAGDQRYVVDNFTDTGGQVSPGPMSNGGSNNNGGGSSTSCSLDNYNEIGIDAQYEAQCKAAYVYSCTGASEALAQQCERYRELANQLNLPPCPYCD